MTSNKLDGVFTCSFRKCMPDLWGKEKQVLWTFESQLTHSTAQDTFIHSDLQCKKAIDTVLVYAFPSHAVPVDLRESLSSFGVGYTKAQWCESNQGGIVLFLNPTILCYVASLGFGFHLFWQALSCFSKVLKYFTVTITLHSLSKQMLKNGP